MFKMIRCGSEFGLVIMVSPPNAEPDDLEARFYRYATWQIYDHLPDTFNEIGRHLAISYFGGMADGLGYEKPPEEIFPTLESGVEFIRRIRARINRRKLLNFALRAESSEDRADLKEWLLELHPR